MLCVACRLLCVVCVVSAVVSVVCCPVEVSETGRSLIRRSSTECGVSECDLERWTMRRSRHK